MITKILKKKEKLDSKESLNRDLKSGARVVYVSQSSLQLAQDIEF